VIDDSGAKLAHTSSRVSVDAVEDEPPDSASADRDPASDLSVMVMAMINDGG
jgi:hypothetical protein